MRHVSDGLLRRLGDEPLAVQDSVTDHVLECARCTARSARITDDTERAAQLLAVPRLAPDLDDAWARLRRELDRSAAERRDRRRRPTGVPRGMRAPRVSLRAGLAVCAAAVVVAGTAAAATLTTIFSPTHIAPVAVSQGDVRALADVLGLGDARPLAGFATAQGSRAFRFGTVTWSSGAARPASSLPQAEADAGFTVSLPRRLPTGVGAAKHLVVQPRTEAMVTFTSAAGSLAGSHVSVHAGPAVVAEYAGARGPGVPPLVVAAMRSPTAQSTGASLGQIEAFLLREPGIPSQLAEEIRLLGDLRTTLPVPVPPGASVKSVAVDGWPGVLLSDSSNAAAGVVWEDVRGLLHVVVGILDQRDVLDVAQQIG